MRDPYSVLGVKRDASADEVKRAFRQKAKSSHPDFNKNDPKAKERFAEINAAYEILGDEAKRKAFDRGEIDAEGKPRASMHSGFDPGGFGGGGFRFDFGQAGPGAGPGRGDPRDVFSDLFRQFEAGGKGQSGGPFGGAQGGARRSPIPPGEDYELEAAIDLEDVLNGASRRVTLPDGRTIELSVPKGVANGATLRLKGQGQTSPFGGPSGDALVTLRYKRHNRFTVDGADLRASVPVALKTAIIGGNLRVPTLSGEVEMVIPPWTSGGKTLRLKGKGLPQKERTGDLLIVLDIDLGPNDPEIEAFFRRKKG